MLIPFIGEYQVPVQLIGLSLLAAFIYTRSFWRQYLLKPLIPKVHQDVYQVVKSIIATSSFIGVALLLLSNFGVDVSAVVSSLGLVSFSVGFAFQDIISNALAGLLILVYRPFARGDTVTVMNRKRMQTGIVLSVDLRYTMLRQLDDPNVIIMVPNRKLMTENLEVVYSQENLSRRKDSPDGEEKEGLSLTSKKDL